MLQIFENPNSGTQIRTELINSQPWFAAKDVCKSLDIKDTEVSLRKLDDDEKLMRKVYASGQNRQMWFVNESGLYNLIFRSNKAEARAFRKWVTSEVLPALRRSGTYSTPLNIKKSIVNTTIVQKTVPDNIFYINLSKAINIAGNQAELARKLDIGESTICELFTRPGYMGGELYSYIKKCVATIAAIEEIPASMPSERPKKRVRKTKTKKDTQIKVYKELLKVEDKDTRELLTNLFERATSKKKLHKTLIDPDTGDTYYL